MLKFDASQIKGLILDMDGVIWNAYHPVGDLPAIFGHIAAQKWKVILATNNSTRSPEDYLGQLAEFGVELDPWQVINSSLAVAHYLSEKHPGGGAAHIMGEEGLHQALNEAGFYHAAPGEDVLAVVAGMYRNINYQSINIAARLIRAGAPFVATNPDTTYPTPHGLAPGAGVMLAALEAASGVRPTIIGKPQSGMYQIALERLGTLPEETLAVGDRLETDIAGAQKIDCRTALVLSGVTSLSEVQAWSPPPDIIAQDLTEIIEILTP